MKTAANTIEDLLEILAGLSGQSKMQIESSDVTIMHSIARQTFKGTALTDRQYALMQEKLIKYKDQFTALDYDFDRAVECLRQPLRSIDRTKSITIVSHAEMSKDEVYESSKENLRWIKIRFPFSKKDIVKLEPIISKAKNLRNDYNHKKGSHEHYFLLKETYLYALVNTFKDSNFTIDSEIMEIYNQLTEFENNKQKYIPGVYDYNLENTNETVKDYLYSTIGKPSDENLLLYKDRSLLFDIKEIDYNTLSKSFKYYNDLAVKIALRSSGSVLVDSQVHSLQTLLDSIIELERFPILILCDEEFAESQLVSTYEIFRNRILTNEISVMFRLEGEHDFNAYVKEKGLNNFVDKNTKVVYINKNKLPKPLLKADWKYNCVLSLSSYRNNTRVDNWIEGCDLVISHDTDVSSFRYRSLNSSAYMRTEKIT